MTSARSIGPPFVWHKAKMTDESHATRYDDLLTRLARVAEARCTDAEPAHDILHVRRVAKSARQIAVGAALLHELFNYPKGHPDSKLSGDVCADHARVVLGDEGCQADLIEPICYAIRVHPFSRGILPETLEAKVLQDADRLDAIGAIGIARCFATCADMKRPFYAPSDPFCRARAPEDKLWGVDHFYTKLLRIPESMHTATARAAAVGRVELMKQFLTALEGEVEVEP